MISRVVRFLCVTVCACSVALAQQPSAPQTSGSPIEAPVPKTAARTDAVVTAADPAVPRKVSRFVEHVLRTCDANRDGQLQRSEWPRLALSAETIDADGDSVITTQELTRMLDQYGGQRWRSRRRAVARASAAVSRIAAESAATSDAQSSKRETPTAAPTPDDVSRLRRQRKFYVSPGRLPAGVPSWFLERDRDGDGQLTLGEYGATRSVTRLREFQTLDHNRDGVLTAREAVRPPAAKKP